MKRILWIVLTVLCIAVAAAGLVMVVQAVRFGEWGRVVFYLLLTILSAEAALLSLPHTKKRS